MNDPNPFEALVQTLFPGGTLLRAQPLAGGISAGMTALEVQLAEGELRRLVVRQPGAAALRHNPRAAEDEYHLLQMLHAQGLAVPRPLYLDASGALFPAPYLVIDYIKGRVEFAPADRKGYAVQIAAQLAGIHRAEVTPPEAVFLPPPAGALPGFPAQPDPSFAVNRIHAALQTAWPIPQLNPPALLHGDYWPGNILWQEGRLAAIIDWEDAAYGDPLVDLAIAQLDLLWIFGREALEAFNREYLARHAVDITYLPYWDLYAALRLARLAGEDLAGWAAFFHPYGRTDITAHSIREQTRFFVEQALKKIAQRPFVNPG